MKTQKTINEAIEYVLSLKGNTQLFQSGSNYAMFTNDVYGMFEIVKCYDNNNFSFRAYIEHGSYNTGYWQQHLFYIS